MVTRARPAPSGPLRVYLRPPAAGDARAFFAAVKASRGLHRSWVNAPTTPAAFRAYLSRSARSVQNAGFVVVRAEDEALVGVLNFSEIVRGAFQSAYLGYYGFAPHAGRGYMTEALCLGLDAGFGALALHRVEANVQPANLRSIALVERLGFTREGYSRRYVKIAGRWRDHVRYAMLAEDWKAQRRESRRRLADRTVSPARPVA